MSDLTLHPNHELTMHVANRMRGDERWQKLLVFALNAMQESATGESARPAVEILAQRMKMRALWSEASGCDALLTGQEKIYIADYILDHLVDWREIAIMLMDAINATVAKYVAANADAHAWDEQTVLAVLVKPDRSAQADYTDWQCPRCNYANDNVRWYGEGTYACKNCKLHITLGKAK